MAIINANPTAKTQEWARGAKAYGEIKGHFRTLVVHRGVEARFLVRTDFIRQCCGRCHRHEGGQKPARQERDSHGGSEELKGEDVQSSGEVEVLKLRLLGTDRCHGAGEKETKAWRVSDAAFCSREFSGGIHEKHSCKSENNHLYYSTTMLSIELNYTLLYQVGAAVVQWVAGARVRKG